MPFFLAESGVNWHYEVEGNGEVLLFIHGWGVNMRIWRQQTKYFSQTHKVLNFDLPGHGKSSWKRITLEEMAKDISVISEKIGIDSFTIIGSSFGGLLGLKIAELSAAKVRRLVLVGSQPKFAQSPDYPYGLEIKWIRKLAGQLKRSYPSMINIFFRSLFTIEERESRRFKWIQTFRKTDIVPQQEALLDLLDILEKEDLRESLRKSSFPLQFIYGNGDYVCPVDLHQYLKEQFPRARFDVFDKCGHFPFLSKPHEFNQVLGAFLSSEIKDGKL
ncbi:MAG: alpha/beta hydrolase [Candidatus Omnitrophota bacterium]